jgi:hypothetical protein
MENNRARFPDLRGGFAESKVSRTSARIALVRRWYESTTGIRTITWIRDKPQAVRLHPNHHIRGGKEMGPHAPEARNEARSSVLVELG